MWSVLALHEIFILQTWCWNNFIHFVCMKYKYYIMKYCNILHFLRWFYCYLQCWLWKVSWVSWSRICCGKSHCWRLYIHSFQMVNSIRLDWNTFSFSKWWIICLKRRCSKLYWVPCHEKVLKNFMVYCCITVYSVLPLYCLFILL